MSEKSYRMLIRNKDKSIDFVIVNGNEIMGENYSASGVRKSDLKYINYIQSKLFYNDNCEYIETNGEYEVYYDKETGIKHFLKNKQESLELLIQYNGVDSIRYLNYDTKKRIESTILLLETAVLICLGKPLLLASKLVGPEWNPYYDYNLKTVVNFYESVNWSLNKNESLDYKGALHYIQESSLDEHTKEVLSNEELLQDMFAYYKGTLLEYSATNKFKDIHISYFEEDKNSSFLRAGFYMCSYPNQINIETNVKSKYDVVVAHEYLHLFQAEGLQYSYLIEASAELCSAEYYNYKPDSYLSAVNNLKLLIEIIGPEPIIKLLFSGDDDEFLRIIRTNLPKEQSTRLLALLNTQAENHTDKVHNEIRELLCELYKAINKKDIREDQDIMYSYIYENGTYEIGSSDCVYLNVKKMKDVEQISNVKVDVQEFIDKGIIQSQEFVVARKNVANMEEYNNLSKKEDVRFYYYYIDNHHLSIEDAMLYGIIDYANKIFYEFDSPDNESKFEYDNHNKNYICDKSKVKGKDISLIEAFEKGYIGVTAETTFTQSDFENDENIASNWYLVGIEMRYTSNNPNIVFNNSIRMGDKVVSFYGKTFMNIKRPGLKQRFKDQYDRLCNIVYQYNDSKSFS